jgi:hypothetical protein
MVHFLRTIRHFIYEQNLPGLGIARLAVRIAQRRRGRPTRG